MFGSSVVYHFPNKSKQDYVQAKLPNSPIPELQSTTDYNHKTDDYLMNGKPYYQGEQDLYFYKTKELNDYFKTSVNIKNE